jgi:hypothetical protein
VEAGSRVGSGKRDCLDDASGTYGELTVSVLQRYNVAIRWTDASTYVKTCRRVRGA